MPVTIHPGLALRKGHRFLFDPNNPESKVKVNDVYPHPLNDDLLLLNYVTEDGYQDEAVITQEILLAYALTQKH